MADDATRRELKPLVQRVDALLRRHQDAERNAEDEVPVLTERADPGRMQMRGGFDRTALEALARTLEPALLARLGPEIERAIELQIASVLARSLTQATEQLHAELAESARLVVRDAIAASIVELLGDSAPGEGNPPA